MKEFLKNKRGVLTLGSVPNVALSMVFIAAIFVGGYLVLDGLGNSSSDASVQGAIGNMTSAFDSIVSYAPTWGTIIGVSVLIGIVIFGFGYANRQGFI